MAFTTSAFDETKPAGTRSPTLGDDDIREFKSQIRERLSVDHDTRADESGAEETTTPTGTIGYHKKVTLMERSSDPTNVANTGILYTKDDGGDTELYWEDDSGNVVKITQDGSLYLATAVLLTGDQTVAGVKTFSSSPIVPTPTTDMQAATKKYTDDAIDTDIAAIPAVTKATLGIDYGSVSVSSYSTSSVSFAFTFSSAPTVVCSFSGFNSNDESAGCANALSITTTGFTMRNTDNADHTCVWVAFGTKA